MDTPRRDLGDRLMCFATRVVRLVRCMPRGIAEDVIARQLAKSATSIGANYTEASHAKSPSDFASKLKICEGEAAETKFWLQAIVSNRIIPEQRMQSIIQESTEITAIFTAATKKAYRNIRKK